jgi:hypothetical protein
MRSLPEEQICPYSPLTCTQAARNGHLEILRFLRQGAIPCPWSRHTTCLALENGHWETLRWLRSQDPPCPQFAYSEKDFARAVASADIPTLQWLLAQQPNCMSKEACHCAAKLGKLPILQWLRAQSPPCPWDMTETVTGAVMSGHFDTVKWMHQQWLETGKKDRSTWHSAYQIARAHEHDNIVTWMEANIKCDIRKPSLDCGQLFGLAKDWVVVFISKMKFHSPPSKYEWTLFAMYVVLFFSIIGFVFYESKQPLLAHTRQSSHSKPIVLYNMMDCWCSSMV